MPLLIGKQVLQRLAARVDFGSGAVAFGVFEGARMPLPETGPGHVALELGDPPMD